MEVKIIRNGKEEVIKISGIKGKHQKEYLIKASELTESSEPAKAIDFLLFRHSLIKEFTGETFKTIEEVEDLEIDELNKLIKAIESKFMATENNEKLKN